MEKIRQLAKFIAHFLSKGMWDVNANGLGLLKRSLLNILKTFALTYRRISFSALNQRASALTYQTLLTVVPLLAVLFAIARGFGFQNIVELELMKYFQGQGQALQKGLSFIDNSLQYAQSGIFIGIGILLLLYTVINLLSHIENSFNAVWKINTERTYFRQFTDYLALLLIAPVFMICDAGISLFINTVSQMEYIGLVISPVLKLLPYIIMVALFSFFYIYIPNTRVKISSGIFAGIIAGVSFQLFQQLYISGQIWISKYNAIYGSFAMLPLFLLWLQLSWYICLLGAELSFSYQNIHKFSFEKDAGKISRRFRDFAALAVMSIIVKRFAEGEKPFTGDEISSLYRIPTQLTGDIIFLLQNAGLLLETGSDQTVAYLPALDINRISTGYVLQKINCCGCDEFSFTGDPQFAQIRQTMEEINSQIDDRQQLLRDM